MRRVAFFTTAALTGVAAFGQGLLDCIEPDVLRALLLQSQGERAPVITAAVPAEFSPLRMPAGLTWIGSAERTLARVDATTNMVQVSAAWRSTLSPDAARAAVAAALGASGWDLRAPAGAGSMVFRPASAQDMQTACRDGKPSTLNVSGMDGVTYVLLSHTRGNSNSACSQPTPAAFASASPLQPHLPRLEVPTDPATGTAAQLRSVNTSFGGSHMSASAQIMLRDSAGNLARHFSRQMLEQGWTSDANWSGSSTAGSTWSKRPAAGGLLQVTLAVTTVDERQAVATLRLSTLQ